MIVPVHQWPLGDHVEACIKEPRQPFGPNPLGEVCVGPGGDRRQLDLRFERLFQSERRRLTSLGLIVLGPEAISEELTPSRRAALGDLHLRRIDLADEVRVVSEGGYVGSATRREIEYARERRKAISSVEPTLEL